MSKLPLVVLNDLRCADCRSYLSYRPVKILANGSGICGRCETRKLGVVSETYETLASIFSYPCKYRSNNCSKAVPWEEVVHHERTCSYKPGCCLCCRHPSSCCGTKLKEPGDQGVSPIVADDKILSKLRCSSCSKYLSSAPIYIAPDGSDICHSCGQNVHPQLPRNIPLETILNAFVFECSYKDYGCHNLYSFSAISVHETDCNYRRNYERSQYEWSYHSNNNRIKNDYDNPESNRGYENRPQVHLNNREFGDQKPMSNGNNQYHNSRNHGDQHFRNSNGNYRNVQRPMSNVQYENSFSSRNSETQRWRMNDQMMQDTNGESSSVRLSEAQKWGMNQHLLRELNAENLRQDIDHNQKQNFRPSQMQRNSSNVKPSMQQPPPPLDRGLSVEEKYKQGMSGLIEEIEAEGRAYQRELSKGESTVSGDSGESPRSEGTDKKEKKKGKVRGLVSTPRGPIYATITPNHAIMAFKSQNKNENTSHGDDFSDDGHRRGTGDSHFSGSTINNELEKASSFRATKSRPQMIRNDSSRENVGAYIDLVQELRFKQKHQGDSRPSTERY